ncbi:MAG: hypothetical protein V9G19_23900 [Tetrasphaera sp.]
MRRLPVAAPTPAAAWAGAVGVVGLCLAWLLTRGSVRLLTVLVAVIAVLAVVAGMVGTARAMFLSQHGFSVAVLVAATAGVVALAAALAVAGALGRWSRGLREEARRFGQNGQFVAAQTLPTELRAVADDPARYHRQIRAEVDRMVRLVDELFEFSRIQAGLMRLTLHRSNSATSSATRWRRFTRSRVPKASFSAAGWRRVCASTPTRPSYPGS